MIELKVETKKINTQNKKVGVIVFNYNNNSDLLGLTCNEWLKIATINYETKFIDYDIKLSLENQIISNLINCDITVVLFAFNPLLTSEDIAFYIDYLSYKDLDVVKLPYGYVFKTDYIKRTKSFKEPIMFNGIANEFLKVDNKQNFDVAYAVLKERIINNHIKNGVNFIDTSSNIIHYFVEIQSGVTIYPFNLITGKTKILSGVTLKDGNTIENSLLDSNCVIAKSVIRNSKIGSGTIVSPFNTIINCVIENDCLIKSYNQLENCKIEKQSTLESFNNIGN